MAAHWRRTSQFAIELPSLEILNHMLEIESGIVLEKK